jgi:hypothetical protein
LLAKLTFDTLEKMLEGGVKIMAQVTMEARIEIKMEELRDLDRWCRLVKECHKFTRTSWGSADDFDKW